MYFACTNKDIIFISNAWSHVFVEVPHHRQDNYIEANKNKWSPCGISFPLPSSISPSSLSPSKPLLLFPCNFLLPLILSLWPYAFLGSSLVFIYNTSEYTLLSSTNTTFVSRKKTEACTNLWKGQGKLKTFNYLSTLVNTKLMTLIVQCSSNT